MPRDDVRFALEEGPKLDDAATEQLEKHLLTTPDDVDARLKLLGYFFRRQHRSAEDRARRLEHVLWFIKNLPAHEVTGSPLAMVMRDEAALARCAEAWDSHLTNENIDPRVLLNAAHAVTVSSPERARRFLERGETLRPDWSTWAFELATMTMRPVLVALDIEATEREPAQPVMDAETRKREAAVALRHYERALKLCKGESGRFSSLADAARAALEAGERTRALELAEEVLALAPGQTENRHHADYVHFAHIILGRLALLAGDVQIAISALHAAGAQGSQDSPVLRSFGPDFSLARELFARGETAAVVTYLDQCARFWNPKRIAFWKKQIESGERPRLHRGFDPDLPC